MACKRSLLAKSHSKHGCREENQTLAYTKKYSVNTDTKLETNFQGAGEENQTLAYNEKYNINMDTLLILIFGTKARTPSQSTTNLDYEVA